MMRNRKSPKNKSIGQNRSEVKPRQSTRTKNTEAQVRNAHQTSKSGRRTGGCLLPILIILGVCLLSVGGVAGYAQWKKNQLDKIFAEPQREDFEDIELEIDDELTFLPLVSELPSNSTSVYQPNNSSPTTSFQSSSSSSTTTTGNNQGSLPSNYSCPDISGVRLQVGDRAAIVFAKVNLRSYAGVPDDYYANIVKALDEGTKMTIMGGPDCPNNGTWWEVRTDDGTEGWMREYLPDKRLLDPISGSSSSSSSSLQSNSNTTPSIPACLGALSTQVTQIGMTIRVTTNGLVPKLGIRPDPTLESHKMYTLPSGTQMTVVEGPICSDNSYFWYVSTPNGYGWVREGNTEFYFIDPIP